MRVRKVFNNSVVLGVDDHGTELVLLGRGVGFHASPGDVVDESLVERTFVPEGAESVERLAAMVDEIPLEDITVSEEIVRAGREVLGPHVTHRVLIPLADHISFALRRARDGAAIEYPLRSEVAYLYPAELAFGREALRIIERRIGVRLPEVEAVPIALHFVNAQFGGEDTSGTLVMTEVLQDILGIIRDEHGVELDEQSVDVARFVTHLRFLFVRSRQQQLAAEAGTQPPAVRHPAPADSDALLVAVRSAKPREYASAVRVGALLSERFDWEVTEQELLYLSLHVSRLTAATAGRDR